MYKVKQEDLIGEIKDFPIEIVQKMVEKQIQQNGEADIAAFQLSNRIGFVWSDTEEGPFFWGDIIFNKDFNVFFDKYPKTNKLIYYTSIPGRVNEIIDELIKLGGISKYHIHNEGNRGNNYYILPISNIIMSAPDDGIVSEFLKKFYTEKFLPIIETIDIDGKKYNKKDIINKIKGLKEIE